MFVLPKQKVFDFLGINLESPKYQEIFLFTHSIISSLHVFVVPKMSIHIHVIV